ncbi:MAG: hypothetical protein AVDCRST_MAG68-5107 [uncultured Gemmatimonadetes bacterium]|uniref:Uncharacterized protein n=1 Tax=uncultured Gemmatimonadota bacterium TaxID=203437 RepID=A0A6J4MRV1_9BACT|nr:MAG: hypothetical protein AVDCRST_MAG68-5107 [uncultured Gemmatimonadota bacterium]
MNARWLPAQVDVAIAKARSFAAGDDAGSSPTVPQVTVLADTVEDLRARVAELERVETNLREELRQVYVVARAIGEKSRDGSIPRFWEGAS